MSAINPSSTAPSLRRLPFTVRLSAQFVNRLLSRTQGTDTPHDNIHGLLFGTFDESLIVVQAFRSFTEAGGNGRSGSAPQDSAFEKLLATTRRDPEISSLELVGWYTVRADGGLLQSDIQFHDLYFKRPGDLALVLKPEESSNVLMELYCRSVNGALSSEEHRWGVIRQTRGSALVSSIEVIMRARIQDDFFLRAYAVGSPEEEDNGGPGWKNTIQFTTRKALGWLGLSQQALTKMGEPAASREQVPLSQAATVTPRQLHPGGREDSQTPGPVAVLKQTVTPATALQNIHTGTPVSVPALIPETSRKHGIPWVSSVLVFAMAAGLTFSLVYSRGWSSGDYVPGFLKDFFSTPGLGLRLESQGDRILLSWNRHHPAIRNAKSGTLQIDDGAQHRQVSLNAAQISNGSVLYRPTSDDVTFRLEVEGIQGGKVNESMRVLEAAPPSTLDLSTPASNTSVSHAIQPQGSISSGGRNLKMTEQAPSISTQTLKAVNSQRNSRAITASPVANPPSTLRQLTQVQDTQPAPPSHKPLDMPVKQKAETQGDVAFDVVSPAPAQAGRSEAGASTTSSPTPGAIIHPTETAQNSPPPEIHADPSSIIEKQNPLSSSTSNSVSPVNTPAPLLQPQRSVPGSYHAPRPLRQVLPNTTFLTPSILAMTGRVEVIVKVNETGHVIDAHLPNGAKKINSNLAGVSILAAKQWIFEPATLSGRAVPSEHSIVFQFHPSR